MSKFRRYAIALCSGIATLAAVYGLEYVAVGNAAATVAAEGHSTANILGNTYSVTVRGDQVEATLSKAGPLFFLTPQRASKSRQGFSAGVHAIQHRY